MTAQPRPTRPWPLIWLLAALGLALALGLHRDLTIEALAARRAELAALAAAWPILSAGVFLGVFMASVAVSLPSSLVLTLAGGAVFGPWRGAALSVAGAVLGACLLFLAVRAALAPLVARRAGGWAARLRPGLERDGFFYLLTLRLVPMLPFSLVNLVAALVGMRFDAFVLATALGILPTTLLLSTIGDGFGAVLAAGGTPDLGSLARPGLLLPLLGLAGLSLLGLWWRRRRGDFSRG